MKKFAHIKKVFKNWNEPVEYNSGYIEIKMWFVERERGLSAWLNDRDVDGKLIQIKSYTELKKKIQDRLKIMGYSDVSEIPTDIKITCE